NADALGDGAWGAVAIGGVATGADASGPDASSGETLGTSKDATGVSNGAAGACEATGASNLFGWVMRSKADVSTLWHISGRGHYSPMCRWRANERLRGRLATGTREGCSNGPYGRLARARYSHCPRGRTGHEHTADARHGSRG